MVDVFISYSRTDLAAVTRLAEAVEAEGYDVWWDADLPPHLSYGEVIHGMSMDEWKARFQNEATPEQLARMQASLARNQGT